MSKSLRIAFMGTPDFAVTALQALIGSDHEVACVYSQPPRPKGRGKKVQASPVHQCAKEAGIEVRTPLNFKNQDDIEAFKLLNLDVAVVAAYGLILPKEILETPKHGCINIHASLLPRWRGAAPIHHAIWSGDNETGITLMQMDEGLDTGAMISKESVVITDQTTLPELHDTLSDMGGQMIVSALNELAKTGSLSATAQSEEGMTYASMLKKEDGKIDWSQSAVEIDRQVRALNPWPGTWTMHNDKRFKILKAEILNQENNHDVGEILEGGNIACGERTVLKLVEVQPENKKSMTADVALNGSHLIVGNKFS